MDCPKSSLKLEAMAFDSYDSKNFSLSADAYGPPWRVIVPVALVVGAVLVYGFGWALPKWKALNALESAAPDLQKGYGALAAEKLDGHRELLVTIEGGCAALIGAYYQSRNVLRLEWASQACLSAGKVSSDAYIGLAASRELTGRDAEAIPILKEGIKHFEKSGAIYYRLGLLYAKNKATDLATQSLVTAATLSPENTQMNFETLQYLVAQALWKEALPFAEKLRTVKTDNPEIKLILAEVFRNNSDVNMTVVTKQEALELLSKLPEKEQQFLRSKYSELMRWEPMVNAPADPAILGMPNMQQQPAISPGTNPAPNGFTPGFIPGGRLSPEAIAAKAGSTIKPPASQSIPKKR